MPCNSSEGMGDAYREDPTARRDVAKLQQQVDRLEAMLCAIIKVTGTEKMMILADWKGAGVDYADLRAWWEDHQKRDAAKG